MKILVFMPYYPPHIGGVEFYAEEMHNYLAKNNNLTIFTPQLPKNSKEREDAKKGKIKILRFPAFEIIANYPLPKFWTLKFWRLFFYLYKQNFDIVISHTRFFNTSLLALIYAKTTKTKWVHIEHGSDFTKLGSKFKNFIAKLYDYSIGYLIFKTSNLNIAISTDVRSFIKKFDKRNTPIIRRGIDIKTIDAIEKNKIIKQKNKNKIIIGYVGRLIDSKGIIDLIKTLKIIKEEKAIDTKFICLILGNGPLLKHLIKLTKQWQLTKVVFFLGNTNRPDTLSTMKTFDIFINPSYTEGLPTTVLEASACKNAIIATDVGGTNEIITHNKTGYLFQPKDITKLNTYILDLIDNPVKIKKFGNNAYKYIKNNFSWEESIKKYEKEFEKLLQ